MRNALIVCFASLSFLGWSQHEYAREITSSLCAPEFHGRGYVNKGDSIAASFLVDEIKKLGVRGYKKKKYLQGFEFNVNTYPDTLIVQQNVRLKAGVDFMIDPSCKSLKGEFVPESISIEEAYDLPELRKRIAKIYHSDTKKVVVFDVTGLKGDSLNYLKSIGREIAKDIPVIELIDHQFMWSVGRDQRYVGLFQIQRDKWNGNENVFLHIKAEYIDRYESQNVIAKIPSKNSKKDPTIVFTAHYDHLGRMGSEAYFPGANDNASGTSMLLSLMKHYSENPVNCNLVFIAFAGEEAGLLGSKYFVEHPLVKLNEIDFLLNLDIMGSGEEGITVVNGTLHERPFDLLNQINDSLNLLEKIKIRGPAANSDHYWFTEKNVPAFFIYTMGPNKHYHDIDDTEENLSFEAYNDILKLLITFVDRF